MSMHERSSGEDQYDIEVLPLVGRCLMATAMKRRLRASIGVSDRVDWTLLAHCRSACGGQKRKLRLCRWWKPMLRNGLASVDLQPAHYHCTVGSVWHWP